VALVEALAVQAEEAAELVRALLASGSAAQVLGGRFFQLIWLRMLKPSSARTRCRRLYRRFYAWWSQENQCQNFHKLLTTMALKKMFLVRARWPNNSLCHGWLCSIL
jgi:hypothetical protein